MRLRPEMSPTDETRRKTKRGSERGREAGAKNSDESQLQPTRHWKRGCNRSAAQAFCFRSRSAIRVCTSQVCRLKRQIEREPLVGLSDV